MERIDLRELYRKLFLNRRFEELLLELFSQGKLFGTTHTSIGQEHIPVAFSYYITEKDSIISNHRCHGHFLAFVGDMEGILGEIMGKEIGLCAGRGGSQHLCYNNNRFFSNGIQGGMVPFGVGLAFAKQYSKEEGIVVNFIGDGTFGEGIIYEAFNIASVWKAPWLIVVENNRYAQSTFTPSIMAGNISARLSAFNIPVYEIETNDVVELIEFLSTPMSIIREKGSPICIVVNTYRLGPHSKGDDFRPEQEIERWKKKDPVKIIADKLGDSEKREIEGNIEERLKAVLSRVMRSSASFIGEENVIP